MMGAQGPWTVAELCAMGYGVETSYGYNLTGNFTEAGVPVPSDLAARLAGEDGKLLKVTNLKADAAFWEAVRAALKEVTITAGNPLPNYWNGTDIGGDVEMTVAGGEYQTTTNMRGQGIRKLTLNLPSGFINSMNNAFVWAVTMEELVINGTVTTNDWTACFDHCTALKTFTAPEWGSGGSNSAYDMPVSQMNSAFQQCPALVTVPQYGTEREAAGNTLRPVSMQNMLNASDVEVLGPVVDCRYIDPASASQCAGAFGTKLTDARLQNLNHGDWWLDGTTGDHVTHGNLAGLDAASVEYLMANLWDLTTDKVGKNWRTMDNSWEMWVSEHTLELTDARAVVNFELTRTGVNANSWLRTVNALTDFKFRVTGLAEGDRLEFGSGVVAPSEASIYEDGEYVIDKPATLQGFKLYNDTRAGMRVLTFEIVEQPYDAGNHMVSSAALHVPEAWRGKLTDAMLNAAAAKGWSVWIGDEELSEGLSGEAGKDFIRESARGCAAAITTEGGFKDCITVARKGSIRYRVHVTGRAAHAGIAYADGISAIKEAAQKILAIEAASDPEQITYNCGLIKGGTANNTVPETCDFNLYNRYWELAQRDEIRSHVEGIIAKSYIPGTHSTFEIIGERPPMEGTPGNYALCDHVNEVARRYGFPVRKAGRQVYPRPEEAQHKGRGNPIRLTDSFFCSYGRRCSPAQAEPGKEAPGQK